MFNVVNPNVATVIAQREEEFERSKKLYRDQLAAKQAASIRQQADFGEPMSFDDRLESVGADGDLALYLRNQPVQYPADTQREIESRADEAARTCQEHRKRAEWLESRRSPQQNALAWERLYSLAKQRDLEFRTGNAQTAPFAG